MRIVEPSVHLEWITPNALKQIELAGRTCYKSEVKAHENSEEHFLRSIVKRGHLSVIEHGSASFRIVTDRGISHEIVRHRLASYSQESTRYCNYSNEKFGSEITVVEPSNLKDRSVWAEGCMAAEKIYFKMLESGERPEIARSVLPTCVKTEIVMTCNFREWRWFLQQRMAKGAHPDARRIARMIYLVLLSKCPPIFEDLEEDHK